MQINKYTNTDMHIEYLYEITIHLNTSATLITDQKYVDLNFLLQEKAKYSLQN